ncbi:MAG: A/G-specific adenine glycosylase [Deltaproteobacteria bacterium]
MRWFRRKARALPWRFSPTPYEVWLSEVMLQQTQIATVIPFYSRFLHTFPTVERLAHGPMERVLELWSGLGYYRRARDFHRAAQVVTDKFAGQFPRDYEQARSLPGVGDYTAKAVLSIAYNLPYAVMDGNVARVMARLEAIGGAPGESAFRRTVERELELLLSPRQPGAFNQALMELGQTVCLPRSPKCQVCPLRSWCRARKSGRPEEFPAPKARRAAEESHLAVAVIAHRGRVALIRGLDAGLLADMWNFPSAFGRTRTAARRNLAAKLEAIAPHRISLRSAQSELRHNITFRSIRVHLFSAELPTLAKQLRWFPLSRLHGAAISQLARKIADRIVHGKS